MQCTRSLRFVAVPSCIAFVSLFLVYRPVMNDGSTLTCERPISADSLRIKYSSVLLLRVYTIRESLMNWDISAVYIYRLATLFTQLFFLNQGNTQLVYIFIGPRLQVNYKIQLRGT